VTSNCELIIHIRWETNSGNFFKQKHENAFKITYHQFLVLVGGFGNIRDWIVKMNWANKGQKTILKWQLFWDREKNIKMTNKMRPTESHLLQPFMQ
jgi:hypothetical protein